MFKVYPVLLFLLVVQEKVIDVSAMFWKKGVKVELLYFSVNHIDVLIAIENGDE